MDTGSVLEHFSSILKSKVDADISIKTINDNQYLISLKLLDHRDKVPTDTYNLARARQSVIHGFGKFFDKEFNVKYYDVLYVYKDIRVEDGYFVLDFEVHVREGGLYFDITPGELIIEILSYLDPKDIINFKKVKEYPFYTDQLYLNLIRIKYPTIYADIIKVESRDKVKYPEDYRRTYHELNTTEKSNHKKMRKGTSLLRRVYIMNHFPELYDKMSLISPDIFVMVIVPDIEDIIKPFDAGIFISYIKTGVIDILDVNQINYSNITAFVNTTRIKNKGLVTWMFLNENLMIPQNTQQLLITIEYILGYLSKYFVPEHKNILVKDYLKRHPALENIFPSKDQVFIEQTSGKNINLVKVLYDNIM